MPPASKTRADMSLRHILNPAEDADRAQRFRLNPDRHNGRDHDGHGYSKSAMRGAIEGSNSDTHNTGNDNDDFKIRGNAKCHGFERQLKSTETRNASHRPIVKQSNDQYVEKHKANARGLRIMSKDPESMAGGRQSSSPLRTRSVLSEYTGMSDDGIEDEDLSSEGSIDNENTQASNLSSLPSRQESSQTTQSSPYKAVSECRCSSPEPVFLNGGLDTTLNTPTMHAASGPRIKSRIQRSRKRQRTSCSPETGEEVGSNQRKIFKSFHLKPTSTNFYKFRGVGLDYPGAGSTSTMKLRRETNSHKLPERSIPPAPLVLSPSRSSIYIRGQSTSSTRLPILNTPRRREEGISRDPTPLAPSPETNSKNFNLFTALLVHPELTLEVSKHLNVETLVDLYAISKDYHTIVDNRFTAFIMGQAIGKASESARIFSFRAYRNLCKRDPAGRIMLFSVSEKEGIERVATAKDHDIRFVPSFRWLKMVLHHEAVVDCILRCLAQEGHRLPKRTTLVLKKLWFTLDITDNGRRIGVLHDTRFWSNRDLFVVTMFFVKLDMRLTDPSTGTGEIGMRKLLLAQKSLETLARALTRQELKSQLELLRLIVRYDYTPSRPLRKGETIFGIPADEVGKLCYEGRGKGDKKLMPIDELIAREAVRRRLNLQDHYVNMMLYGYINKRTFEDIKTSMALLPTAMDSDSDGYTERNGSETDEEIQQEFLRRERMGLFQGETNVDEEEAGDEQEEDSSLDEQEPSF